MEAAVARLEELARSDTTAAPLALLRAEALKSAADPAWVRSAPSFDAPDLGAGTPLLAGKAIPADERAAQRLLGRLAALARSGVGGVVAGITALPDAVALLEASINLDDARVGELAKQVDAEPAVLGTLGQLLALPLLQSFGREAGALPGIPGWQRGYCPVCAAWPALAEVRGTGRERWLHCGRCGCAWRQAHLVCVFCGNDDHGTQGYLAPEGSMATQQATTCERCHGYLKSVSTLVAMELDEVFLKDLSTLELDMAAMERGCRRPAKPGFALGVRIMPL